MDIVADKSHYGSSGWESDLKLFADVAINVKQWLGTAGEHLHAAQVLLPGIDEHQSRVEEIMRTKQSASLPPSLTGVYFMLCSLAAENSFKSVIAVNLGETIKSQILADQKLPKVLLGHDLVDLAYRADYEVDLNREHALRFLSRYGIWGGRYPIPVSNSDYAPTERHSNGEHYLVGGYDPKNISRFLSFGVEVYEWASAKVNKSAPLDKPSAER